MKCHAKFTLDIENKISFKVESKCLAIFCRLKFILRCLKRRLKLLVI